MNKIRILKDRVKKEIDSVISSVLGNIQRIKYLLKYIFIKRELDYDTYLFGQLDEMLRSLHLVD